MIFPMKRALRHLASLVFVMSCAFAAHANEFDVGSDQEQDQDITGDIESSDTDFGPSDHFDDRRNNQCQWHSNNPYQCDRMPGCQYSRIYSQCLPSHGPGPGPRPGPFPPGPGPGPGPGPFPPGPGPGPGHNYCSNYNYNYSACVQSGCRFDGNSGTCYNRGNGPSGPIPPQPPRPRLWTCVGFDTGMEEHDAGHSATAYDRYEAERQALQMCQRYHGRCYTQSCHQN